MRKFLLLCVFLVLVIFVLGCGLQEAETGAVDDAVRSPDNEFGSYEIVERELPVYRPYSAINRPPLLPQDFFVSFAMIEDFFEAHRAFRHEEDLSHINVGFDGFWVEDVQFSSMLINLTELRRLHLPANIPEGFYFVGILVDTLNITVRFVSESYLYRGWWGRERFDLVTTGWNANWDWMDRRIQEHMRLYPDFTAYDLVSGKYLYYRGAFYWEYGTELLTLRLPGAIVASDGIEVDPNELLQYTAFRTIDLLDYGAVYEFLAELRDEA